MHFGISSTWSFQRKTKRHVFLLLFVLTHVHLNWPSYATWKCYQSPRQLISTMKHWRLYITINSLTIFKWKMRNLRLNLIYLSFFVQYRFFLQKALNLIYVKDNILSSMICGNVDSPMEYNHYLTALSWRRYIHGGSTLTTPVGWLSIFQLTVLSLSASAV